MGKKERNINLDFIRCVAVCTVITVHFFLNTNFYEEAMPGKRTNLMIFIRTSSMVCVPLFILLTGYLMNTKKVNKKYYQGCVKTLSIYILISIFTIIYQVVINSQSITFKSALLSIFSFKAIGYSWYIEMYLGLFLLIPFLNIMYNTLSNQRHKILLIVTLLCLSTLPSLLNIFDFNTTGFWSQPSISENYNPIVPSWWVNLYPITYYIIGAYLKEYKLKMATLKIGILFTLSCILFSFFNIYRSTGSLFMCKFRFN